MIEPQNSSNIYQTAYIGAYSVTGGSSFSPVMVFGQRTGNTAYNERMRIDTAGNVGIGTTAPARLLHVNGPMRITPAALPGTPAAGDLAFDSTAANALKFYDGTAWQTVGTGSGSGDFMKNGSVAMTGDFDAGTKNLKNIGNIGIGTTNPAGILDVEGGTAAASTNGTNIKIVAQSAGTGGNNNGGNIALSPGAKTGTGTYGAVTIGSPTIGNWIQPNSLYATGQIIADGGMYVGTTSFVAWGDNSTRIDGTGASGTGYLRLTTKNTERMRIDPSGNVGIGTASPVASLDVLSNNTATSGSANIGAVNLTTNYQPASAPASGTNINNVFTWMNTLSTANLANVTAIGGNYTLQHLGGSNINTLIGFQAAATHGGTGTASQVAAGQYIINNNSTGTISSANGLTVSVTNSGGGTITNTYGVQIGALAGTNKWGIYQSDATANNYYAGNFGIGTTAPARLLHVNGPMRITPSALPGTPAAGDLAFDSAAANALKFYDGSGWKTVGTGTGSGDFMKDGSVAMTGNFNAGGNSVLGNTTASANLTLESTSSATKGFVLLQPNGGSVAIGTTSPANGSKLDVEGSGGIILNAGNVGIGAWPLGGVGQLLNLSANDTSTTAYITNTTSTVARYPSLNITNYMGATASGMPQIQLQNNRGSSGSATAVQAGDILGAIVMGGSDNSGTGNGAEIFATPTQTWTSSAHGSSLNFQTVANGSTSLTTRMVIDNSGNVGIGTTSPACLLHVNGPMRITPAALPGSPVAGDLAFDSAASNALKFYDGSGWQTVGSGGGISGLTTNQIPKAGSSTTLVDSLITDTGTNVGIGTTSPSTPVDILTTKAAGSSSMQLKNSTFGNTIFDIWNGTARASFVSIAAGGTAFGGLPSYSVGINANAMPIAFSADNTKANIYIAANGNVGIGTTSPSGSFDVKGGTAANATNGSSITLTAQNAGTGNQNGGNIFLNPGTKTGTGTAGGVGIGTTSIPASLGQNGLYVTGQMIVDSDSYSNGNLFVGTGKKLAGLTPGSGVIDLNSGATQDTIDIGFNLSPTTKIMTLKSSGNVGIGTTSPPFLLTVQGAPDVSGAARRLANFRDTTAFAAGVGGGLQFSGTYDGTGTQTGFGFIQGVKENGTSGDSAGALVLGTIPNAGGYTERMRITSAGYVGIGTTAPGSTLDIVQSGAVNGARIFRNGAYNSEGSLGLRFLDSTGGAVALQMGVDTTLNAGFIQAMQPGTSWTNRPLLLQANGGNVGIGTTNPIGALQIYGSGAANKSQIRLTDSDGGGVTGYIQSYSGRLGLGESVGGADSMVIKSGNVGIGTTSPSNPLTVSTAAAGALVANFTNTNTSAGGILINMPNSGTPGNAFINFQSSAGYLGGIAINGANNGVTYGSASDRRLKENIGPTEHGLDLLQLIPVMDFNFKTDKEKTRVQGFIAQELFKIYPEAVTTNGDNGTSPLASGQTPWHVDYGRLTPLLVRSIQELKSYNDRKIEQLEKENAELKAALCEINPKAKICNRAPASSH